ncbi:MAG: 2-phosphosulfolactate phosphatase [Limisphaerales bacterium]
MNIEVILAPAELSRLSQRDLSATACVVFDILRATSAFVTALHNGASAIIPVSEISEALAMKAKRPRLLMAGERNGMKIRVDGAEFDFGNSPREFAAHKVKGRTIVSTTTNGTRALRACAGAKTVLAGAFLNLKATAKFLMELKAPNALLVCAGTGENAALEDVLAAGALCQALARTQKTSFFSDSARVALAVFVQSSPRLARTVCESENARRLLAMPELRDDVAFCLQQDVFDLAARMNGEKITLAGAPGASKWTKPKKGIIRR